MYVCAELRNLIDYTINGTIIPIAKDSPEIGMRHYGKNILFKYKNTNDSNITIDESFKNFVLLLRDKFISKGINQPTVNNLVGVVQAPEYNIYNCLDKLTYAVNMFAHRAPYYEVCNFISDITKRNVDFSTLKRTVEASSNISFKYIDIPKGALYVSGLDSGTSNINSAPENNFFSNQITYLADFKDLATDVYNNLLNGVYMKQTITSRVMCFRVKQDTRIINLSINNSTNAFLFQNDVKERYAQLMRMMNQYYEYVSQFLGQPVDANICGNYLLKTDKTYEPGDGSAFVKRLVLIQNIFNTCMQIKYPEECAYTLYNHFDKMNETITLNTTKFLKLIAVIKPLNNYIMIFKNITMYNKWAYNLYKKYENEKDDDIRNKINETFDPSVAFSKLPRDIRLMFNDPEMKVKTHSSFVYAMCARNVLNILGDNEYDIFTNPIVNAIDIVRYHDIKLEDQQYGGYEKYKKKYIELKKKLKN